MQNVASIAVEFLLVGGGVLATAYAFSVRSCGVGHPTPGRSMRSTSRANPKYPGLVTRPMSRGREG
jgi:hypothetical protein